MIRKLLIWSLCLTAWPISACRAGADESVPSAEEYEVYAVVIRQYSDSEFIRDTSAMVVVLQVAEDDDKLNYAAIKHIVDSGGGLSVQFWRKSFKRKPTLIDPVDDSTMTQVAGSAVTLDLVGEFARLNAVSDTFKVPFPVFRRVALLTPSESRAMRDSASRGKSTYYRLLERRFPHSNGEWEFSRVALDHTKNFALVYVGHMGDLLGGRGRLVLLHKSSGIWKVAKVEMEWSS